MPESKQVCGVIPLSPGLMERLQALASASRRTIGDLIEQAVEREFGLVDIPERPNGEPIVEARLRLIDRLAQLEAGEGDPEELLEQVRLLSRRLREAHAPQPANLETTRG